MATHPPPAKPPKPAKKTKAALAKAAKKAGSQKPGGVQPCPLASKKEVPCDIVDLVLTAHIAKSAGTVTHAKIKDEDVRVLSSFGTKGKTDGENLLEVVTYRLSDHNKTKITAAVTNFASHASIHPMLRINQAGEVPKQWTGGETAKVETEVCTAPFKPTILGLAFSTLWNFQIQPVRYVYSVTTCGIRHGPVKVGGAALTVAAYPGDEYAIEYSSGAQSKKDWLKPKSSSGGDEDPEPKISVKRNGSELMEGKSLQELLQSIGKLKMLLRGLEALIAAEPKAGVLYNVSADFWEGSLALTWGWKQDEGMRVYYGVSGECALTLVSLDLSLGFGIDWKLLVVKVEIAIENCKVKLSRTINLKFMASQSFEDRQAAKVSADAVCRALASAGYGWCSYKVELGVKSGIEGEMGLSIEPEAAHLFAKLTWTGVRGYFKSGTPSRADSEDAIQLVEERELIDWKSK